MAKVIGSRMSAEMEGEFVVFLIGMRINKPWKIHKWLPVFLAMPRMLKELEAHPESGFLGHIMSLGKLVPASGGRESARERFVRARSPEGVRASSSAGLAPT